MTPAGVRRAAFLAGAGRATVAAVAVVVVLGFGVAVGAAMEDQSSAGPSAPDRRTGPNAVDIGFSQDMIVHHEQAVLLAQLVRDRTTDPKIAALAAGIEDDQLLDIGTLRGYLTLWHAPMLPAGPPMQWMTESPDHTGGREDAGATGGTGAMPGMAGRAEINALRTATGDALDALFLRLMLRHHQGGQGMLADAAAHASIDAVRALASRIAFHQSEESRTIAALLATRNR